MPAVPSRESAKRENLLSRRRETFKDAGQHFGIPEWLALVLYAGLVAWLTVRHEPWPDEAQAWLIARDNTLGGMLRQLHYEGTPALWHVLLWIEARLHFTYAGMHWVSSAIGLSSAFLLLRFSPFPRWLKLLLPFGSFLLYQGPVIARSYDLSILLMFVLAALYRARRTSAVSTWVVCGLLANTSLFGLVASVGWAVLFLGSHVPFTRRVPWKGVLALCAFLLVAIQQSIPAPDATFNVAGILNRHAPARRVASVLTGIPVNDEVMRAQEVLDAEWKVQAKLDGVNLKPEDTTLAGALITRCKRLVHAAIYAVSASAALALLFYAGMFWWLALHRKLSVALPFAVLLLLGNLLNYTEHHVLILWGALVATLWMAWPRPGRMPRRVDLVFCLLLLAVLVEQIGWSISAARQEVYGHFDPGTETAAFLQANTAHRLVETVTYYEVSSQPYLSHNPYRNVATTYWPWAFGRDPAGNINAVLRDKPDMIVASTNVFGNDVLGNTLRRHVAFRQPFYADKVVSHLEKHGYRVTHQFCGRQPIHFSYSEENCLLILEPGQKDQPM